MRYILVPLALAALVLPASAAAGGWATVQLSSTPKGARAGTPWTVDVTVLQHGRTPLAGVKPTITIRKGALATVFKARPNGKLGVYRARVIFPSGGMWRYEVYDGFVQYGGAKVHRYAAVKVLPRQ
jgi:hypothetical protein